MAMALSAMEPKHLGQNHTFGKLINQGLIVHDIIFGDVVSGLDAVGIGVKVEGFGVEELVLAGKELVLGACGKGFHFVVCSE